MAKLNPTTIPIDIRILGKLEEILQTLKQNHQEWTEHMEKMHRDDSKHAEKEQFLEQYMGMVKKAMQPHIEEQEEWDKKLGKDKK